jgi:hypothetical protein
LARNRPVHPVTLLFVALPVVIEDIVALGLLLQAVEEAQTVKPEKWIRDNLGQFLVTAGKS